MSVASLFVLLERLQALKQWRMRVVQKNVKGMRGQIRKVAGRKFLERINQALRLRDGLAGKVVGFVLIFSGNHLHHYGEQQFYRSVEQAEEQQSGINGRLLDVEGVV